MKTWKLVSGILSIILFVLVAFQSCAVGISNTLSESEEISGTAGIIVAILMLTGGIVSISTRKSKKKSADIALIILFCLAAFFGLNLYGSYGDLKIWSYWCLINAIMALIDIIKKRKKIEEKQEN